VSGYADPASYGVDGSDGSDGSYGSEGGDGGGGKLHVATGVWSNESS
jgi:hypothetical protein